MSPVLLRTLADERRRIIGWVVGTLLLVLVTAGSWPGLAQSSEDFEAVLANLPDALTAFFGEGIAQFSAAGLVGSRLFGTIGLALMIGYAVSRGARNLAGDESDGTLELVVTMPLSRRTIALDKVAAMFIGLLSLILIELGALLVMMPLVDLDFAMANLLGASAGLFLLSSVFGGLAFLVGAATGRRTAAVGVAGGAAGGLFLLTGVASLVDALEPLATFSPFSHYDGTVVLDRGVDGTAMAVFTVLTLVFVGTGVVLFERRDLT